MRRLVLTTAGTVDRVDLSPFVGLLPSLVREWEGLRFGPDGRLRNPLTGRPLGSEPRRPEVASVDEVRLRRGTHRAAGAEYSVTVTTPPFAGDAEAGIPPGADATVRTHIVTVVSDDGDRIVADVRTEGSPVASRVEVDLHPVPEARARVAVDLAAALRKDGAGCLAPFAGAADGTASLDLGPLLSAGGRRSGGTVIDADGRCRVGRAAAVVGVTPSLTAWDVDVRIDLRSRGLGRLVLPFVRTRIRTEFEAGAGAGWASLAATVAELRNGARELPALVAAEGGPDEFVRRGLWSSDGHLD